MSKIIVPDNQIKRKAEPITGFGYIREIATSNIITKAVFEPGTVHDLPEGLEYIEVAGKDDLKNIEVYKKPKSQNELDEDLIQAEIIELARAAAIESLKIKNKLATDFVDAKAN